LTIQIVHNNNTYIKPNSSQSFIRFWPNFNYWSSGRYLIDSYGLYCFLFNVHEARPNIQIHLNTFSQKISLTPLLMFDKIFAFQIQVLMKVDFRSKACSHFCAINVIIGCTVLIFLSLMIFSNRRLKWLYVWCKKFQVVTLNIKYNILFNNAYYH